MAQQNPFMSAMTSGAQVANQGASVANSMMMGVQKSMDSSSDLAFKLTNLLNKEQARKVEQTMQFTKQLQDQYQFGVKQQFAQDELDARQSQWNEQNKLGKDKLGLAKDVHNLNRFKAVSELAVDSTGKMDKNVYKSRLDTIKAKISIANGMDDTDIAGLPNMDKQAEQARLQKELNTLESTYFNQSKGGISESMRPAYNSAAKAAGFPTLEAPTSTGSNVPLTPPAQGTNVDFQGRPITQNYTPTGTSITPAGTAVPQTIGQAVTQKVANQAPLPSGIKASYFDQDTLTNTITQKPTTSSAVFSKGVVPMVNHYKGKSKGTQTPNKWEKDVLKDKRILDYFTTALASPNSTVSSNAYKDIKKLGLSADNERAMQTRIELKFMRDNSASMNFDETATDAGQIVFNPPEGDSLLAKQMKSKVQFSNDVLTPTAMDTTRQYFQSGSQIEDAMSFAGSYMGLNMKTGDEQNAQLSSLAKRLDAENMRDTGVPTIGIAVATLNQLSSKTLGDPTQPFYFGSGLFGYSGQYETAKGLQGKVSYPGGVTEDVNLHEYVAPVGADLYGKIEDTRKGAPGMRSTVEKSRQKRYEEFMANEANFSEDDRAKYRINADSMAAKIQAHRKTKGYNYDGKFNLNLDAKVNVSLYNFHTKKFENVSTTVENLGLMLGSTLAPVLKFSQQ